MENERDGHLVYVNAKQTLRCKQVDDRCYGDLSPVEVQDEDLRGRCGKCGRGLCVSGSTTGYQKLIYVCRHGCGASLTFRLAMGEKWARVPVEAPLPPLPRPKQFEKCEPGMYWVVVFDRDYNAVLRRKVEFPRPQYALTDLDIYLGNWIEVKG